MKSKVGSLYLPMKAIALGNHDDKFWDQWSLIGICMYLNVPKCSKWFGSLGVTFIMYFMSFLYKHSISAEFWALPRYRKGSTLTGNSLGSLLYVFGVGTSSPSGLIPGTPRSIESPLIRKLHKPRIVDSSLGDPVSVNPTQCTGNLFWKAIKPPGNR